MGGSGGDGPWGVENLTIGSKPVRNFGRGREGWAEAAAAAAAATGRKKDEVDGPGEKSEESGGESEKAKGGGGTVIREDTSRTEKHGGGDGSEGEGPKQKRDDVVLRELGRPAPNNRFGGKGDAASVRTEQELGPEVCARSLG